MNTLEPTYEQIYQKIKHNWDTVAKPIDGLGVLETLVCRIGAIQGTENPDITKRCVLALCADNGIVEEGISQAGQEVTFSVAGWMGTKTSSVCHLAKTVNADVIPVDIGMCADAPPAGVRNHKIARGTKNFLKEPAMTEVECRKAIETGIALAKQLKEEGYQIIATGEMGIGNTTTSTALYAVLFHKNADAVTGRGAGLNDAALEKKKEVIRKAAELYADADPFTALCSVGGFDLAGLAGVFIGGAWYHIPVIIDGAISAMAAVCAEMLEPGTKNCMIPSHIGKEAVTREALQFLGLDDLAVLHAGLALGEGTGAVLLFPLLDAALALYHDGNRFAQTDVEQYERFEGNDVLQAGCQEVTK